MLGAKRALVLCTLSLALPVGGLAASGFPPLAPLPGTGTLAAPADPASFFFVVAGDNRPPHSGDPQPATLTTIVQAIHGMTSAPAFTLWAGDTISGKKPTHEKKVD